MALKLHRLPLMTTVTTVTDTPPPWLPWEASPFISPGIYQLVGVSISAIEHVEEMASLPSG